MVDPAVAYQDYDAFNHGRNLDVFLKRDNGSIYQNAVWPGVSDFSFLPPILSTILDLD